MTASISPWKKITGLPGAEIDAIVFDATHPGVGLVGSNGGVIYRTTDGGANWVPVQVGGTSEFFRAVSFSPANGLNVYAFSENDSYDFDTPVNDVYASNDGGLHWAKTAAAPVDTDGTSAYYARGVDIDATGTTIVLSDHYGGIFRTVDGGANWSNPLPQPARPYAIVTDPGNPQKLWTAGFQYINDVRTPMVWRSTNFGATWTGSVVDGLASGSYAYGIAVQPGTERVFLSWFSDTAQGLLISANGGKTWKASSNGLANYYPGNASGWAVFDPADATHILLSDNGGYGANSVFESTDSGRTWTGIGSHVSGESIFTLGVRPATTGYDAAIFCGDDDLFASTDSGASFAHSQGGMSNAFAMAVVDDLLTASGFYGVSYNGLFHSTNNGTTWNRISTWDSPQAPYYVAVDAKAPSHTLYVSTGGTYLLRSTDAGADWTDVSPAALSASYVSGIATDPSAQGRVYLTVGANTLLVSGDSGAPGRRRRSAMQTTM